MIKIAIASGKGGTGKTFVSTNLFWAIQNTGKAVSLVDCDAEEPNVAEFISGRVSDSSDIFQNVPVIDTEKCLFCGRCYNYCSYNAIVFLPSSRFIQVVEDLCHDCGACSVACKNGAITEKKKLLGTVKTMAINDHAQVVEARAEVGVYSPVPLIKKAIKEVEPEEISIFDSPPGISCPFIATVDKADFVVLVTEPTPFGLNDLKLSVETLQELKRPFGVIINRAGMGDSGVYDYLKQNSIPLLMEIPFDREIARTYSEGRLLVEQNLIYREKFSELLNVVVRQIKN